MIGNRFTDSQHWFGRSRHQPDSECRLFCLPYSGAGASVFHGWQRAADPRVEVMPVRLPGREDRICEPVRHSPAEIAAAIASQADRPYGIYGHSIGARLGFEVIRSLRRSGAPPPLRFYPAAARPPDVAEPLAGCAELPDDEFLAALTERIAAPTELRDLPELRKLLLPVLRADFRWVGRYRYLPEPPLAIGVVAVAGSDDPETGPLQMLGWSRHTSEFFRLHTLPGDHFFVRAAASRVATLVTADLLDAARHARGAHHAAGGGGAVAPGAIRGTTTNAGPVVPAPDVLATPSADEVHVWFADLNDLPGICAAWEELSPREARRAHRIRDEAARRAHIGQCVILRRILRRYGTEPGTQELPTGTNGKPEIRHPSGIRFNVSRSGGLVLVGITTASEIGVDIERIRPMPSFRAFCAGALDPGEYAELMDVAEAERLTVALRIWTAKEAVLKASGDGLTIEPSALSFAGMRPALADPEPGGTWRPRCPPEFSRLARWHVLHLPLSDAVAAIAITAATWRLRFETVTEATPA